MGGRKLSVLCNWDGGLGADGIQTTTKGELNSSEIMATAEHLLTGFFIFSKLILGKS